MIDNGRPFERHERATHRAQCALVDGENEAGAEARVVLRDREGLQPLEVARLAGVGRVGKVAVHLLTDALLQVVEPRVQHVEHRFENMVLQVLGHRLGEIVGLLAGLFGALCVARDAGRGPQVLRALVIQDALVLRGQDAHTRGQWSFRRRGRALGSGMVLMR